VLVLTRELLELVRPIANDVQRRSQLVRQRREELVLHLAQLFGGFARLTLPARDHPQFFIEMHVP
jgi:hypothetical protein